VNAKPQAVSVAPAWSRWLQRPRTLGVILIAALTALHLFADTPLQSWLRNA